MKNTGLSETKHGDYIPGPASDLINNSLHVDDTFIAGRMGYDSVAHVKKRP